MRDLHIGIMSGTSLDGADAVLMDWSQRAALGFASKDFHESLRSNLLGLCQSGADEIERSGHAGIALARHYADLVSHLLSNANIRSSEVTSIGCHGQTIRHRPESGFTVQVQNPALLAELTGISVVADFRSRDMAAGGQGAPLAPAFHADVFSDAELARAVINIGGISNITMLAPGMPVRGYDSGPGNVLMDAWIHRHLGKSFDENGIWAASGNVDGKLLDRLLAEPYLGLPPPKSTGRELFNAAWLDNHLSGTPRRNEDVQATLLEFTARTLCDALRRDFPDCQEVFVCGGGARNPALMARLASLTKLNVCATDDLGIPSGQVEAIAFSWLARRAIQHAPTDLRSITGSRHPVVLGAIYPA